jgi:hypothetical protein
MLLQFNKKHYAKLLKQKKNLKKDKKSLTKDNKIIK